MELRRRFEKFRAIMLTSLPTRTLYGSSSNNIPGWFYKLTHTHTHTHTQNLAPLTSCALLFLPRRSQQSPRVCIKHQACRTAGGGAEHFKAESAFCGGWQNSQMAPTGQRTIPAADAPKATGLGRSLSSPPSLPSHPTTIPFPTFISEKQTHSLGFAPGPRLSPLQQLPPPPVSYTRTRPQALPPS